MVDEEQLEAKIEQADLVREKTELAIINIDEALTNLPKKSKSKKRSPSDRESSCSPSSCSSEANQTVGGSKHDASPSPPEAIEKLPVTLPLFGSHPSTTATPTLWTFTFPPKESWTAITSSVLSGHSSSPGMLTQVYGEPVSSVCTTYNTSVCGSGIMTPTSNSRMPPPTRVSFACNTDNSYVPFLTVPDRRAFSVPVTLPEMTVSRGPPPLIPLIAHDIVGHTESHIARPHVPTADDTLPTQNLPMHGVSTYITTPLMETSAPTQVVAPGICGLNSSGVVVRVADYCQMPSLAPYAAPAPSSLTAPTGVTHIIHARCTILRKHSWDKGSPLEAS